MSICQKHPQALNDGDCIDCLRECIDCLREEIDGPFRKGFELGCIVKFVERVNARAEADLKEYPLHEGAHRRAIEVELAAMRAATQKEFYE